MADIISGIRAWRSNQSANSMHEVNLLDVIDNLIKIFDEQTETLRHYKAENERLKSNMDIEIEENARLRDVIKSFQSLMDNSHGVSGYHLNGEVATWGELGIDEEIAEALATEGGTK